MDSDPVSKEPVNLLTKLSNRAAALAFASAFMVIAALVSLPHLVTPGGGIGRRIAAAVALIVAIAVTGGAWRARVRLTSAHHHAQGPEPLEPGADTAGTRAGPRAAGRR